MGSSSISLGISVNLVQVSGVLLNLQFHDRISPSVRCPVAQETQGTDTSVSLMAGEEMVFVLTALLSYKMLTKTPLQ